MNRAGSGTRCSDSSSGVSASGRLPADLAALLGHLEREFRGLYGKQRYGGLVLYGSYARGEADAGSDVDLLVLLEGEVDPVRELIRLEDVKWPLALESGYALSVLAVAWRRTTLPRCPSSGAFDQRAYRRREGGRGPSREGRALLRRGGSAPRRRRRFYVAEGLLLSEGLRYPRHGQEVVAQYGRHFASEGRLNRRYHRFLSRTFELRQLVDYAAEIDVDPAVVSELIKVGEEFLEAATDYLGPQEK